MFAPCKPFLYIGNKKDKIASFDTVYLLQKYERKEEERGLQIFASTEFCPQNSVFEGNAPLRPLA